MNHDESAVYDKVDENGRRYRVFGRCSRDYEPMVIVGGTEVPLSQEREARERLRKSEELRKQKEREQIEEEQKYPSKDCPLKVMQRCYTPTCDRNCVFMDDYKCTLALIGSGEGAETKGKYCSIVNKECYENCMFYDGGCAVVKYVKKGKENE